MANRDSRGASYMDDYDAQSEQNTYASSKKYDDDSSGGCAKHTLFGVNFIMLLIGVILIVVVFFMKENGSSEDIPIGITDTVLWTTVIAGALIIIVSFLGCVGARTEQKCILIVFIVLLVLCLLLEIVAIIIIFAAKDIVKEQAKEQWNGLTDAQKASYEGDNDCQGFEGCYDSIEQGLMDNMMVFCVIKI
eukprot:475159_1